MSWEIARASRSKLAELRIGSERVGRILIATVRFNRPAAVRAPVHLPPCIRQRPLRTPHRAAFDTSPDGLPFFNRPRRGAWGSSTKTLEIVPRPPERIGVFIATFRGQQRESVLANRWHGPRGREGGRRRAR